jgi:hypothetical protein
LILIIISHFQILIHISSICPSLAGRQRFARKENSKDPVKSTMNQSSTDFAPSAEEHRRELQLTNNIIQNIQSRQEWLLAQIYSAEVKLLNYDTTVTRTVPPPRTNPQNGGVEQTATHALQQAIMREKECFWQQLLVLRHDARWLHAKVGMVANH